MRTKQILNFIKLSLIVLIAIMIGFLVIQQAMKNFENNKNYNDKVEQALTELHYQSRGISRALNKISSYRERRTDYALSLFHRANGEGRKPGRIYYFVDSNRKQEIRTATRLWNQVHLGVFFQETFNKNEAGLFFKRSDYILKGVCEDPFMTCLGAMMNDGQTNSDPGLIVLTGEKDAFVNQIILKTITHEIGHYLGLDHQPNNTCSVMVQGESCYGKTNKCFLNNADRKVLNDLYPLSNRHYNKLKC